MKTSELAEKLVTWIRERVLAGQCQGAVLGMSGGVDSSVAAVLCHQAFPQNTLGVVMPCYSSPEDEEHALALASKFSIAIKTVPLDSVFDSLLKVLPESAHPANQIAEANLKARLRMLTLYYFANQFGYMVVGSSNRNELSTGYFTKYGDGGVDILPLGNLLKAQIKDLANFLGIPEEIISKPPSAGFWAGQTDEDELGLSYDQLDRYLANGEAPEAVRVRIESLIATSQHKRLPPLIPDFKT